MTRDRGAGAWVNREQEGYEKQEEKGWEAGFPKWWELGEKDKYLAILCTTLQ